MNQTVENKIARLDCWRTNVEIEPLGGGMTNLNFKVIDANEQYVVRLGDDDPVHLISRRNETECCRAAFETGVSPELVYTEPGVLVVRFIEGKVFEEADVRIDENLRRIIDLLRRFHQGVPQYYHQVPVMFWVFQVLRHYQHLLKEGKSRHRDRLVELSGIAAELEKMVGEVDIALFDLSNLASNNELTADQEVTMSEDYFDCSKDRKQWRSYYAMKCASLLRETLWSMVSEIHSDLDIDFPAYTAKNLERFEQAFEEFRRDYQ
jgi:thiamine kinase-like enzyme